MQIGYRLFGIRERRHLGGQIVAGGLQLVALGGHRGQIALQRGDGVLRVADRIELRGQIVALGGDLLKRGFLLLLLSGQRVQLTLQVGRGGRVIVARGFRLVQKRLHAAQFFLRGLQIGLQLSHLIGERLRAAAALFQLGFLFSQQRLLARQLVFRIGQLGERIVIVLLAGFKIGVRRVQTALQIGDGVQPRLIARAQLRRFVLGGLELRLQLADGLIGGERVLHVLLRRRKRRLRLVELALRRGEPLAERRGFLVARLELIGQRLDGRLRLGERALRLRQLGRERIGAVLQRAQRLFVRLVERVALGVPLGQILAELIALFGHVRQAAAHRAQLDAERNQCRRQRHRQNQHYDQCLLHRVTLLYQYGRCCPYSIRLQYTTFPFHCKMFVL